MKYLISLFAVIVTLIGGIAQNLSEGYYKTIILASDSKQEIVEYNVENGSRSLAINLTAKIKTGQLEVWIQDPDGKKVNSFQLQCSESSNKNANSNSNSNSNSNDDENETSWSYTSTSSGSSGAKGVMEEKISQPVIGEWKVYIRPQATTGTIDISIND